MKLKRLAAFVAISMCLATAALGSDWNVGNGLWGNANSWTPIGVPDGTNATIDNGGTATLQTNVFDITTLEIVGPQFDISRLTVLGGADLTTTGNAVIGSGALLGSEAIVTQSGGTLSFGANLTIGTGSALGEWTMSNGTIEVTDDLTIGSSTDGVFSMSDGGVTVHGSISVAANNGLGTMTVSGGTVLQDGAGDSLRVGTSGTGTFRVEGDTSTINVVNYEQGSGGVLDVEFNDDGITTIFATGNINLSGTLRGDIAFGASPSSGIYDLIVADGTMTGQFGSLILDHTMEVRYELNEDSKNAVRLYVDTEAPELPIQGQLPGDQYNKIISVNFKGSPGVGYPGPDQTPDVADGAGTVAADNWNNLLGTSTLDDTQLVDNSGASAVSMSVTQASGVRADGFRNLAVAGDPSDPNLNLYGAQASIFARDGGDTPWGAAPSTLLTGLHEEFPYGYDVIVNTGRWVFGSNEQNSQYVRVHLGPEAGATRIENRELHIRLTAYEAGRGFEVGRNYVKFTGLMYDTLDLRPFVERDNSEWNGIQITGVQILGLAPGELPSLDFVVDNLDPEWEWWGTIQQSDAVDAWRTEPMGVLSWYGRTGSFCTYNTPEALPFTGEATEYEVYTWVASERPNGAFYIRDTNAMYTIEHAFGTETIYIDQNTAVGEWLLLGVWSFTGDGTEYVRISGQEGSGRTTSYDAMMWRYWFPEAPVEVVPEPAGLGLIGLALLAVRRRRS